MGKYVKAAITTDLKDGAKKKVSVDGKEILLARVGTVYYAIDNKCPHMGGDLSNGTLEGTVITCPLHGSQFDITNGQNKRWLKGSGLMASMGKLLKPPRPVKTYNVKVEGNDLSVEV